jgi:hypothetical protein
VNAVTTPIGNLPGMIVRAIWSAMIRKIAPRSNDNGTKTDQTAYRHRGRGRQGRGGEQQQPGAWWRARIT